VPIILGVDPGLGRTGYGVVRSEQSQVTLVEGGTIEGGAQEASLPDRLHLLHEGLRSVIAQYRPDALAIEQLYSHYAHPMTAVLMGHARGVLCLAAAQAGVPVFDYPATAVKSSLTGNGRAPKEQVRRAVQRILAINRLPEPLDISDALAIAIAHCYRQPRSLAAPT